jgi:hypothetical protein
LQLRFKKVIFLKVYQEAKAAILPEIVLKMKHIATIAKIKKKVAM